MSNKNFDFQTNKKTKSICCFSHCKIFFECIHFNHSKQSH